MKILFWADGFYPRVGGVETQGMQFVVCMQQRGHQCTVIAQKDQAHWQEDDSYQGVPIKRLDFNAVIAKQDLSQIRAIEAYLRTLAVEFQPDIIYLNALVSGSAFIFLLFGRLFNSSVVASSHASCYEDEIHPLVKQICFQAQAICCGSEWGTRMLRGRLPSLENRIRTIYYGIQPPDLNPAPLPLTPPILLLIGRFVPEKGFDTAIRAFSYLKKTGSSAKLLIAGDGVERISLEQLVDELGIANAVEFTGEIPRDAVYTMINRAALVLVPSYKEAFGLVALESLQMGRPVIASNTGGLPEIVSEPERGMLVPPKDPEALFKAIQFLLNQPEILQQMGENARQWALHAFSLKENVDQYEEIFNETTRQHHPSSL